MDDTDYAFGRSRAEYDRLIEQGELFRPLTERMLLAAGITRGMRVLDVGCGVGDVSFLVATVWRDAKITACVLIIYLGDASAVFICSGIPRT